MKTSAAGLAFISREEGCIDHPYNDSANHATIGVGHLIHLGPVTAADRRRYAHWTRADSIRQLRTDIRFVEREVNRRVQRQPNQNEFDAFVSITFNIGNGGFRTSTFLRRFNAGDRRGCAAAMLWWNHPPELTGRRHREVALFLKRPANPLDVLRGDERKWVEELDRLRKAHKNVERRRRLVHVLTVRRIAIREVAHKRGWDHHHWRARYRILTQRTT